MSYRVWKFPLNDHGRTGLTVPKGASPLHVDYQNYVLTLWMGLDPDLAEEGRAFQVIATGEPVELDTLCGHVGTVQRHGFVWHVFEVTP